MITELRRALSESEKRNEEINREFQKLLRQKEVFTNKILCLHVSVYTRLVKRIDSGRIV